MKKLGFLSFVFTALISLTQPAEAGASDKTEGRSYPNDSVYESNGQDPTVRQVQRALQEDGYYTGDNRGNFCFETRVAVRRYQRDKGLRITGKIDDTILKTLRLR